ncbi:MAG: hypothetical protein M1483_06420 [Actinobacteria bacterium]|nr:hypothetical protein [Actinomycetota bacterium]MCL6105240.1 hypothetical protein [Actinomycetota bacterium]
MSQSNTTQHSKARKTATTSNIVDGINQDTPQAQAVLTAWHNSLIAAQNALLTENPFYPQLLSTTLPPQLYHIQSIVIDWKRQGWKAAGRYEVGPVEVTSLSSNTAVINGCGYDKMYAYIPSTGQPVPGQPGHINKSPTEAVATLVRSLPGWKVSQATGTHHWSKPCPVS